MSIYLSSTKTQPGVVLLVRNSHLIQLLISVLKMIERPILVVQPMFRPKDDTIMKIILLIIGKRIIRRKIIMETRGMEVNPTIIKPIATKIVDWKFMANYVRRLDILLGNVFSWPPLLKMLNHLFLEPSMLLTLAPLPQLVIIISTLILELLTMLPMTWGIYLIIKNTKAERHSN